MSLLADLGDGFAWIGGVVLNAIALGVAIAPLWSILEAITLVTGVAVAPAATALAILVAAGLLESYGDWPVEDVFLCAVVTLVCFALFSWLTGHSGARLELTPIALLAETLVYLAAASTAVAITLYTDRGDDRTRDGTEAADARQ